MAENMKLNDEAMAQASGGKLEPGQEGATITGIVMVDPYPDNPAYKGVYRECESKGYQASGGCPGDEVEIAGDVPVSAVASYSCLKMLQIDHRHDAAHSSAVHAEDETLLRPDRLGYGLGNLFRSLLRRAFSE